MRKIYILCLFSFLFQPILLAQINIATGDSIFENFNSMGTSPTATLPANWRIDKQNSVFTTGDFASALQNTQYSSGNNMGNIPNNGIFNFGAGPAGSATDRAIGFLSTSNATKSGNVYVQVKNNGTVNIHQMDVHYNVEKYRNGSNNKDYRIQLHFSYDGINWTDAGAAFETKFIKNGNNTGFNPAPGITKPATGTLSVNIPAGNLFYLCWNYSILGSGGTNNGQALGIDDVKINKIKSNTTTLAWHYRSINTGFWKNKNNWETSETGLSNWVAASVMPSDSALTITVKNGHTITVDSSATGSDVNIELGAVMNNQGSKLEIRGNLRVNGTVNGSQGDRLVFRGNGNQKISGNGTLSLSILTINKNQGSVTLERPVIVDNLLELKGKIFTSAINLLTLGPNSTVITDNSFQSYIDGPLSKIGGTNFTYPVGKDGIINPISISDLTESSEFRAEYFPDDAHSLYSSTQREASLDTINRCEYWMLDRITGTASARVTLGYSDECGPVDPTFLAISKWDGTEWTNQGNGTYTGDTISGTVTSLNLISQFSPFAMASVGSSSMPVSLLEFTAVEKNKQIELKWITASEVNNDYFIIEKSSDGLNFEFSEQVKGAGNSFSEKTYNSIDKTPFNPYTYYRLTQVDYDGSRESFPIIVVKTSAEKNLSGRAYYGREGIVVKINSAEPATIDVLDMAGNKAFKTTISGSGEEQTVTVPSTYFHPGLYLIYVTNGIEGFIEKVLVNK
ncbi:MAG: T9SS type A sorting domain-containing protein [Bacteroidetes bacterium]|nr:T9SS type A sorting domain-containing protein [Bacteroidota bacterium]